MRNFKVNVRFFKVWLGSLTTESYLHEINETQTIIALSFSHSYSAINQAITSKGQKMTWRYEMSEMIFGHFFSEVQTEMMTINDLSLCTGKEKGKSVL